MRHASPHYGGIVSADDLAARLAEVLLNEPLASHEALPAVEEPLPSREALPFVEDVALDGDLPAESLSREASPFVEHAAPTGNTPAVAAEDLPQPRQVSLALVLANTIFIASLLASSRS